MLGSKYRIYPTLVQKQRLKNSFRLCRDMNNHLLQYCKDEYRKAKENGVKFHPTHYTMCYEITRFKKIHPEYSEVYGHALQGTSKRLASAYRRFFMRLSRGKKGNQIGFPRFKKKLKSILYQDAYGCGYQFETSGILGFAPKSYPALLIGILHQK